MELRSQEILVDPDGDIFLNDPERAQRLEKSAASHYHLALKDLSVLLDNINNSIGDIEDTDEIDAVFALWYLMLQFGLFDSDTIGWSHVHLEGIGSFLKPYLQSRIAVGKKELPPASQQLLLFISYIDMNFSLCSYDGGRIWIELFLSESPDSPLSHDRLWNGARSCLPMLWGAEYPASELFDDLDNHRPLYALHLCQKAKLEFLKLANDLADGHDDERRRRDLWNRIQEMSTDFTDVLVLARIMPSSNGRRSMTTVFSAAMEFYTLQVLFACLCPGDQESECLDSALSQILNIAYKVIGEDQQLSFRSFWPLSVALLTSRDQIHQEWLRRQLKQASILCSAFSVFEPALNDSGVLANLLLPSGARMTNRTPCGSEIV